MKKIFKITMAFALSLVLLSFSNKNEESFSLTIHVDKLRNSKGVVQFALYNKEGSIPDEKFASYYKISKATIVNGSATITFENLPKGRYAVNILHDENKNGTIDKGLILPKEGIGFSNFKTLGLRNRPNFEKASFKLETNLSIKVQIVYF
ncbi:MAG TPA: hypothetical protein DCG69_10415 [Bacteroidales bacterium]|nr:hypothetical protein [Bacteroidales bacterium]